jgi:hypothetical protein
MTVKGFDALYEEPEDTGGPVPLPGTDAYLAFVAEKKRREKERTRKAAETPLPPDDNQSLSGILAGTDTRAIPENAPGLRGIPHTAAIPGGRTGIVEGPAQSRPAELSSGILAATDTPPIPRQSPGSLQGTAPARLPHPPSIPVQTEHEEVEITDNYMRFDLDIFDLLRILSEGELRIYLDFVRRSYGQSPPRNTCSVTRRKIGATAGVASPNAQVTVIQRLEQKGLIKRLSTATGKNQASKFRVFLPSEIPGHTSKTIIRYSPSNPSSQHTTSPVVSSE